MGARSLCDLSGRFKRRGKFRDKIPRTEEVQLLRFENEKLAADFNLLTAFQPAHMFPANVYTFR